MTTRLATLLESPQKTAGLLFLVLFALFSAVLCTHAAFHKGDLICSDGRGYFIHLPGLLVDHDLDDSNNRARFHMAHPNHWPVGLAVAWSPFYLVGHGVSLAEEHLLGRPSEHGNGFPEQLACCLATIAYGSATVALTYLFLGRWYEPRLSLLATLGLFGGTNLAYYTICEPYMSHAVCAFWVALMAYVGLQEKSMTYRRAMLLGLLAGLAALTRPQAGLFLLVPMVWSLAPSATSVSSVYRNLPPLIFAGLLSLAVFYPQVMLWKSLDWEEPTAQISTSQSITAEDDRFNLLDVVSSTNQQWLSPKWTWALFDPSCGLVLWHPLTLLALLGLILLLRSKPRVAAACLMGIVIQLYVVASWWGQGQSFGGRMMCNCFILLAPGLVFWFSKAPRSATAVVSALGLLNLFAMLSYRHLISEGVIFPSFQSLFHLQ